MKKLFLYIRKLFRSKEDEENYQTNLETKKQTDAILKYLKRLELDKLDRIMEKLNIKEEVLKASENAYDEAKRLYPNYNESAERTAFVKGVRWEYKREKEL